MPKLWPKGHFQVDSVALERNVPNNSFCERSSLRELNQELSRSRNAVETSAPPSLQAGVDPKALLGDGRFEQQTVARLKQLCRDHRITGFSKLKKASPRHHAPWRASAERS